PDRRISGLGPKKCGDGVSAVPVSTAGGGLEKPGRTTPKKDYRFYGSVSLLSSYLLFALGCGWFSGSRLGRRCRLVELGLGCLLATHPVISQSRSGRNQPADDDVLLQAAQFIALAHDRRLGKHA